MNIQYIFIFNTNIILLKIKKTYKYTRDMYIYIKTADERFVSLKKRENRRRYDGGGIGWGDHFLLYKIIERTFER